MFKKNGSTLGIQPASTIIRSIPIILGKHGALQSSFLIDLELVVLKFPPNSLPPEDHVMKAWEYEMIAYFLEISNPENPFFQSLTKFQKCMFKESIKISYPQIAL